MTVVEHCPLRLTGAKAVGRCLWGKNGVLANEGLLGALGLSD